MTLAPSVLQTFPHCHVRYHRQCKGERPAESNLSRTAPTRSAVRCLLSTTDSSRGMLGTRRCARQPPLLGKGYGPVSHGDAQWDLPVAVDTYGRFLCCDISRVQELCP